MIQPSRMPWHPESLHPDSTRTLHTIRPSARVLISEEQMAYQIFPVITLPITCEIIDSVYAKERKKEKAVHMYL